MSFSRHRIRSSHVNLSCNQPMVGHLVKYCPSDLFIVVIFVFWFNYLIYSLTISYIHALIIFTPSIPLLFLKFFYFYFFCAASCMLSGLFLCRWPWLQWVRKSSGQVLSRRQHFSAPSPSPVPRMWLEPWGFDEHVWFRAGLSTATYSQHSWQLWASINHCPLCRVFCGQVRELY